MSGNFFARLSNKGLVELKTFKDVFMVGSDWVGMIVDGSSLERYRKTDPF
jgi:hypothetical protein